MAGSSHSMESLIYFAANPLRIPNPLHIPNPLRIPTDHAFTLFSRFI